MKTKILIWIVGVLMGASVATGAFCLALHDQSCKHIPPWLEKNDDHK